MFSGNWLKLWSRTWHSGNKSQIWLHNINNRSVLGAVEHIWRLEVLCWTENWTLLLWVFVFLQRHPGSLSLNRVLCPAVKRLKVWSRRLNRTRYVWVKDYLKKFKLHGVSVALLKDFCFLPTGRCPRFDEPDQRPPQWAEPDGHSPVGRNQRPHGTFFG